ncbi:MULTISPECIES: hypothetical protein [Marinobacter]|jgi:hypothetical protein|uniref:hypothetical protein n=1 Tax=Marinobacter TaxID=2742 RepID=UPI000718AEED|nr:MULTISPECIES: hypothetical protein [Marinobacter]AMQ89352.1 hypothetical protein ASQ50_11930 [Marinobacter sp. LQ44]
MTTASMEPSQAVTNPLDSLKQIRNHNRYAGQLLLAGNRSALTSLLVVWFPVIAVLTYGFVVPFTYTAWGENNLLLILYCWTGLWLALTAASVTFGTGRHVYSVDLANHTISHLNSEQSTSLALELRQGSEGSYLDLKTPLDSGWHLGVDSRIVAELTPAEVPSIRRWQPAKLKDHIRKKVKDGSLTTLFVVANIPLVVIHLVSGTFGFLIMCQIYMLAAWTLTQTLDWFLEKRDQQVMEQL